MSSEELVCEGLLTVKEACEFLRISRTSLWRLMDAGTLPFCYWQRSRRLPRNGLVEFAAKRVVT